MTWIKKDSNIYMELETGRVVDINILLLEIKDLQEKINMLNGKLLEYPNNADDRVRQAVDLWNEQNIYSELVYFEQVLREKEKIYAEIMKYYGNRSNTI